MTKLGTATQRPTHEPTEGELARETEAARRRAMATMRGTNVWCSRCEVKIQDMTGVVATTDGIVCERCRHDDVELIYETLKQKWTKAS